jgi:hypothetical protein
MASTVVTSSVLIVPQAHRHAKVLFQEVPGGALRALRQAIGSRTPRCDGLHTRTHALGMRLLLQQGRPATALRQVASRRCGRCELRLVSAMVSLLQQDPGLYHHLVPRIKLKLEGQLANVS